MNKTNKNEKNRFDNLIEIARLFNDYAVDCFGEMLSDEEIKAMENEPKTELEIQQLQQYKDLFNLSKEAMYEIESSRKELMDKLEQYYGSRWEEYINSY